MSPPSEDELDVAATRTRASLERLVDSIDEMEKVGASGRRTDRPRPRKSRGRSASRETVALPWKDRGACRGVAGDWLDIPPVQRRNQRAAKAFELALCDTCPVIVECLDWAMTHNEPMGIWGGKLPWERRRLRRSA